MKNLLNKFFKVVLVISIALILGLVTKTRASVIISEEFIWQARSSAEPSCKTYKHTLVGPGVVTLRTKMNPFRERNFYAYTEDILQHDLAVFGTFLSRTINGDSKANQSDFLGKPIDRITRYKISGKKINAEFKVCNPVRCGLANCSQYQASATIVIDYTPDTAKPAQVPPKERLIFSTGNDYGVLNGGTPPSFLIKVRVSISYIMTYHWNNGQGATAGTIALRDTKGKIYGPWKVKVRNKVYWEVSPNVEIPPGTYQVIDSSPSTWAQNPQSGGKGHTIIKGMILPD